jgi:hypothetical protein
MGVAAVAGREALLVGMAEVWGMLAGFATMVSNGGRPEKAAARYHA